MVRGNSGRAIHSSLLRRAFEDRRDVDQPRTTHYLQKCKHQRCSMGAHGSKPPTFIFGACMCTPKLDLDYIKCTFYRFSSDIVCHGTRKRLSKQFAETLISSAPLNGAQHRRYRRNGAKPSAMRQPPNRRVFGDLCQLALTANWPLICVLIGGVQPFYG